MIEQSPKWAIKVAKVDNPTGKSINFLVEVLVSFLMNIFSQIWKWKRLTSYNIQNAELMIAAATLFATIS